ANSIDVVRYLCELKTAKAPSHEAMLQKLNVDTPEEIAIYLTSRLSQGSSNKKTSETKPGLKVADTKPQSTSQAGFFYPNNRTCFSLDQIAAIEARIAELDIEVNGCFSFLYVNHSRKDEKKAGLYELLRIGREPNMKIAEAIKRIENDDRYPELQTGKLSNRTGKLLDQLKASDPAVVSNRI
ncbi:MAG: hypothetical protein H0T84_09405, partial [Tatlockia sp.]|nr:hypothetical protein [Tatlockia sp.]